MLAVLTPGTIRTIVSYAECHLLTDDDVDMVREEVRRRTGWELYKRNTGQTQRSGMTWVWSNVRTGDQVMLHPGIEDIQRALARCPAFVGQRG